MQCGGVSSLLVRDKNLALTHANMFKKNLMAHQDLSRNMGSGFHAETGCRKIYAEKVFESHKDSMEA